MIARLGRHTGTPTSCTKTQKGNSLTNLRLDLPVQEIKREALPTERAPLQRDLNPANNINLRGPSSRAQSWYCSASGLVRNLEAPPGGWHILVVSKESRLTAARKEKVDVFIGVVHQCPSGCSS